MDSAILPYYNFEIDWGDGTKETYANPSNSNVQHTYMVPKDYIVSMSGTFPRFTMDCTSSTNNLITVDQRGVNQRNSMESTFAGCRNLRIVATDVPDLSRVKKMNNMFDGATNFNGDLSSWDVSEVTTM